MNWFPELEEKEYELGWDGTLMKGTLDHSIAFDTETEALIDGKPCDLRVGPPRIVLATVSDGSRHFVLPPEQLPQWILSHKDQHIVGHNFSFDFWVVHRSIKDTLQYLKENPTGTGVGENLLEDAMKVWWEMGDKHQFHDTMLLDLLVMLAEGKNDDGSDQLEVRNLGVLAKQYCPKIVINKEDPFRMRYHELLPIPFEKWEQEVDPGFFTYAINDVKGTREIWKSLLPRARKLQEKHLPAPGQKCYSMYSDSMERFGVLTEQIQVKGSIGLLSITHNGMRFDPVKSTTLEDKVRKEVKKSLRWLKKNYPGMFTMTSKGEVKLQEKSQLPSLSTSYLKGVLQALAHCCGIKAPQSEGKLRGISTSVKTWKEFHSLNPFFDKWISVGINSKLLGFFDALKKATDFIVRSNYKVLVRTGRTACSRVNLQQMPRDAEFRSMFVAAPGKKLITIDYSAIELRTLATVCKCKLGYSKLGEVFSWKEGRDDPHSFSSSMIMKISFEEFLEKLADPKTKPIFKKKRQLGKGLNFGIPGGLAKTKLAQYVKSGYETDLSEEDAGIFRSKIINEVFPELNESNGYLASFSLRDLSRNTGISYSSLEELLKERFHNLPMFLHLMEKISKGFLENKKGKKYGESMVERIWEVLEEIADQATLLSPARIKQIRERKASIGLGVDLFSSVVTTLTGRLRGKVGYTQAKNTPFQSLAADGGKLATWRLVKEGYRVVAFVHDELVVEVEEANAEEHRKKIDRILVEEMEKVLTPPGETKPVVPVKCESGIDDCWGKP